MTDVERPPASQAGWLLRLLTRLYRNSDWLENPPPRRKFYRLPGRRDVRR